MKQWMMIAAAIAGFALQPAASAVAADYPVRPITLIVPQAPGGGNDVIARILAETMSRTLGQQIIVENRPGAGGTIGTRQLAKSPPDGYTLVMGSTGTVAMAPSVFPNVGYDPRKDFAPIGLIARSAIVLVVGPAVAAQSVRELIEAGKNEPGKLTYGSGGVGSGNHLAGALFATMAGIKMTHVPFRGANPAINDVIGGHLAMIFSSLPPTLGHIKSGQAARSGDWQSQALSNSAGPRDHRRIRIAWLPGATDLWPAGSGRHAGRDRQAAQRRIAGGVGLGPREGAHRRRRRRAGARIAGGLRPGYRPGGNQMVESGGRGRRQGAVIPIPGSSSVDIRTQRGKPRDAA